MQNKIIKIVTFLAVLFYSGLSLNYAQEVATSATKQVGMKTVDVDKDGNTDVTYYHDSKHIIKAEADTNNDGKPDITVYTEEGKFKEAHVDTNYDGKTDKKFNDASAFNKWLNENNPGFNKYLNPPDWEVAMFRF